MEIDNYLYSVLEKFPALKILVVGDAILDSNIRGIADRLSIEAPVPVVNAQESQDIAGGAANVAVNVSRLGASVRLLSVIGEDPEGDRLMDILRDQGVDVGRVIRRADRQTLLRRRIFSGGQLLLRYDQGSSEAVDEKTTRHLFNEIKSLCHRMDVVILSDYGRGVLTNTLLNELALNQQRKPCILVADTRRLEAYKGLRLAALRPSYASALEMIDGRENGDSDPLMKLGEAGEALLDQVDTQMVAITLDDNGALVVDRNSPVYRTYGSAMPFNRVNGAGDAFIGALALGLAAGAHAHLAAEIASAVATSVVKNNGMPTCCREELRGYLSGDDKLFEERSSLKARIETLRKQGKRIVFTNGVFDILHSAHVNYLNQAKALGDVLVIGVNSDESVRRLKGPNRPINHMVERMRVLAGLSCVDLVTCFTEENPINLIHMVQPDVYVKGGDYTRETLPEAEVVESYGGELKIVPYIADHSTTGVIERIRERYGESEGEEQPG